MRLTCQRARQPNVRLLVQLGTRHDDFLPYRESGRRTGRRVADVQYGYSMYCSPMGAVVDSAKEDETIVFAELGRLRRGAALTCRHQGHCRYANGHPAGDSETLRHVPRCLCRDQAEGLGMLLYSRECFYYAMVLVDVDPLG